MKIYLNGIKHGTKKKHQKQAKLSPCKRRHSLTYLQWAKPTVSSVSQELKNIVPKMSEDHRLKVHKNENFFGFDFEFCTISLLVMSKY
jgi:hypothetical protein